MRNFINKFWRFRLSIQQNLIGNKEKVLLNENKRHIIKLLSQSQMKTKTVSCEYWLAWQLPYTRHEFCVFNSAQRVEIVRTFGGAKPYDIWIMMFSPCGMINYVCFIQNEIEREREREVVQRWLFLHRYYNMARLQGRHHLPCEYPAWN